MILGRKPSSLHCEFRQDRTGVMITAYRIAFENSTSAQALREIMAYGLNRLSGPSMVTYVGNLPHRLEFDPRLREAVEPD